MHNLSEVKAAAQAAADAAYGDSNDEEIELLQGALQMALAALGLPYPDGKSQEDM